jgi:hypothetical protein
MSEDEKVYNANLQNYCNSATWTLLACITHPNQQIYFFFFKVWGHAATLFIYFYIYRAYIQYFIYYSYSTTLDVLTAFRSVEGLLWGAEPRFELGPAVQQADELLSVPCCTLVQIQKRCLECDYNFPAISRASGNFYLSASEAQ